MLASYRFPIRIWLVITSNLFVVFLSAGSVGRLHQALAGEPAANNSPRLAVLLIFDQMRADYILRWEKLFGERGFRRLQQEGAWFRNCYYPYSDTITGAGHASIATGCSPAEHGIIENDWYDRTTGKDVNCVVAGRYERVPTIPHAEPPSVAEQKRIAKTSVSPERLLAPTLGDALKQGTGGKGRVVALSLKDRSAVLPAGRRADACYWFDTHDGIFVTSTYYRLQVHPWVAAFNATQPADHWFGKAWTRFRPDLEYEFYSGPDDVRAEGRGFGQERTFPHPMMGGKPKISDDYYQAVITSPYGNELLLELALRAVDAEHLGRSDAPDLLSVSFSSNDLIGHCWGPDSQEVFDVTLRSDQIVQRLLDHLDSSVGKGRYVVALTADHGVCPLPEVARAKGKDAGRVPAELLGSRAEAFLDKMFGQSDQKARWLEAKASPWIYLNRALLQQRGLDQAVVEEALAGWLKQQPGVLTAYTRSQLLKGVPAGDSIGVRVRRSFQSDRSGDVAVVLKPYYLFSSPFLTGTTHGTPHEYDTHVPLMVLGTGIRPGVHAESVTPLATATILAHALGIPRPARSQAPLPEGVFVAP
ncbi:MAG TPA: alkaline phosphatase family protein [Gemmataceae bacterium]|nr:alkaline phosphatase family protein [Gemmataceae bacterium]